MSTMQKTPLEREQIKIEKAMHKEKMKGSFYTPYESFKARLIVYTQQSPKVKEYRSTHSFVCYKSEISGHIQTLRDAGYVLGKVYYNNKPYYE